MSQNEFTINEDTFEKMLELKNTMGYNEKSWDKWFKNLLDSLPKKRSQSKLESIIERLHLDKSYEEWVKNFSLNLNNIWQEKSARDLDPSIKDHLYDKNKHSALVIGAGPSVEKHNHLETLAQSNYKGSIICTDRALKTALKAGVIPEKFSKFYVVSIDPEEKIKNFYRDELISAYGSQINGIFSTVLNPLTVDVARKAGIKIHWLHTLIDFDEGRKSFNQISALMVRTKNHANGLPALQTGGNVGTSSWFVAWQILKCANVGLIGINHSWDRDDPWELITSHCSAQKDIDKNSPLFKKLFPEIYNPEFDCYCILDPIFQFYSTALKEFISRSPSWLKTINATEGGCIFGQRIKCMPFENFLRVYTN